MMNPIQQIPVDLIDPHPSNPRRDLGDLTELADSIRAQGIRQNLLVTPWGEGRYRTIIGHRRLAAAKLAGLTLVPAAIDEDVTAEEQLELMLVENIQRNDLSPIEEAEGYQGLLDLGVEPSAIAKRTGRSAATVKGRLKLLSLPDAARQQVHARQLTLEDAATIAEFDDDEELVKQLLADVGTQNWRWRVENARKRRADAANRKPIVAKLKALGFEPIPDDAVTWRDWLLVAQFSSPEKVGDADEYPADAVFEPAKHSGTVALWQPKPDADLAADDERDAAAAAARAQRDADQAAGVQALALRDAFVAEVMGRKLTTADRAAIVAAYVDAVMDRGHWSGWDLTRWLGGDTMESTQAQWRARYPKATPEHALLAILHAGEHNPYQWPDVGPDLARVYGLLELLGYEISDAEAAALAGEDAEPASDEDDGVEMAPDGWPLDPDLPIEAQTPIEDDLDLGYCSTCGHPLADHEDGQDSGVCWASDGGASCQLCSAEDVA